LARGILRTAREQNATQLVVGKPIAGMPSTICAAGSLLNRLISRAATLTFTPSGLNPTFPSPAPARFVWRRRAGAATGGAGVVRRVTG